MASDSEQESSLFNAITSDDLGGLKKLLLDGGANVGDKDQEGKTALLFAAYLGRLELVQWLLSEEGGSSIEERDNNGMTAFLWAAREGHAELIDWLSDKGGASLDGVCGNEMTALCMLR